MKPGDAVLHYRLERELGRGGMGTVWLALDTRLERFVALKFLRALGDLEGEAAARLAREARAASALDHPGVVTVHAIEESEAGPFVVMEYVRGERLDAWVERRAPGRAQVCELVRQAAEAVGAAHAAGSVHRDLKPSNLQVDERGGVRVLDFGLATVRDGPQLTRTGSTVGTLGYIAPEQLRGERVGPAADVFALGVVLHELVCGAPLFDRGQGAPGVIHDVLERDAPPVTRAVPDLPAGLDALLARALAKDPAERFADANALAEALRPYCEPADADPAPPAGGRGPVRRPLAAAGVVLACVTLGLLAAARFLGPALMGDALELPFDEPGPATGSTAADASNPDVDGAAWTQRSAGIFAPGQRDPDFSPDGTRLAFVAPVDGVAQLFVTALEDPAPLQLTFASSPVSRPRWSPDGDSILYLLDGERGDPRARSVHVVQVLGGRTRRRVEPARFATWHPSGEWFAYEWGGVVRRHDLASGATSRIEELPPSATADFERQVAFSPDGTRLVYRRSELGPLASLWELDLETGERRPLVEERARILDPVYLEDGRRVAFTADLDGALNLYAVDVADGRIERLTTGLGSDLTPAVDPISGRVAHVNLREEFRLVLFDPATGERRDRLVTRNALLGPRFSPDGSRIAFFGGPGEGADVFVVPTEAGNPVRVADTPAVTEVFPQFDADGRSLLFYREAPEGSAFVRADVDDGSFEVLFDGWSMQERSFADLSPDGRRVAVFDVERLSTLIQPLPLGAPEPLAAWAFRARWSPDGERVVGVRNDGAVVEVEVATGEVVEWGRGEIPTYGPDGRIHFLRPKLGSRTLCVLDPASGAVDELCTVGASWDPNTDQLDVGPDGRVVWSEYAELGSEILLLEPLR